MPVVRRTFEGESDLVEMQRLVAGRTGVFGVGTNLHPGDVAHRIYSGLRKHNLDETVPVWEDDHGIAAFGIIWPGFQAFDVAMRVGLSDDERAVIVSEVIGLSEKEGRVETDVFGADETLLSVIRDLGFEKAAGGYVVTGRTLVAPSDVSGLPFILRSADMRDVVQLARVHSGAFGSDWTPESYLRRMQKPGYIVSDEIVAVAQDGTFAGFTNTWYDDRNKIGYFEPVGVHRDFHRMGVGSALLREGMNRMIAVGMTTATVWHSSQDEGAATFYRSNGFEPLNTVSRWERVR